MHHVFEESNFLQFQKSILHTRIVNARSRKPDLFDTELLSFLLMKENVDAKSMPKNHKVQ